MAIENAQYAIDRLGRRTELVDLKGTHEEKVKEHWDELRELAGMNTSDRYNARRRAKKSQDYADATGRRVRTILNEAGHGPV